MSGYNVARLMVVTLDDIKSLPKDAQARVTARFLWVRRDLDAPDVNERAGGALALIAAVRKQHHRDRAAE